MTNSLPTAASTFVDVGGVTLHMRRDGAWNGADAAPPLLYLHALGTDMRIFDHVVARLPQRRHLRFDQRGHGLSNAPEGAYSIEALSRDALGLLARNGVERAVLVGVGVGGLIALRTALDSPDAVAGLVLANTAAKLGEEDVWSARIEAVAEQGVEALADSTLLGWFSETFRDAHEPLVDGLHNMISRTSAVGYACTCAALAAEDLSPRLHQLRAKALVVGGSDDASTPPPTARELAAALPAASLTIIDDAGHLPMVDSHERFTELLLAYLAEL